MTKLAATPGSEVSLSDVPLGRNPLVRRIFKLHHGALLGFLKGRLGSEDEASDLAQEAYLRLCRQRDLERLRGKERSYLFKIADNLLRDRHRRRAVRDGARHLVFEEAIRSTGVEQETPQSLLEDKQALGAVKKALLGMDPKLRQVFLMRRMQSTPFREIAARLGVSERTVERRMSRALRHLKNELRKQTRPDGVF